MSFNDINDQIAADQYQHSWPFRIATGVGAALSWAAAGITWNNRFFSSTNPITAAEGVVGAFAGLFGLSLAVFSIIKCCGEACVMGRRANLRTLAACSAVAFTLAWLVLGIEAGNTSDTSLKLRLHIAQSVMIGLKAVLDTLVFATTFDCSKKADDGNEMVKLVS